MFIVHVFIQVKKECIEAFGRACCENASNSINEPGVLRFDVLRQKDKPEHFVLVEIYRAENDALLHKQTLHYLKWREEVEPMMAEPRKFIRYDNLSPIDENWQ